MFWDNTNYRWVRKRFGGVWLRVGSRLDASGGVPYWIRRTPFSHEIYLYAVERYPEKELFREQNEINMTYAHVPETTK